MTFYLLKFMCVCVFAPRTAECPDAIFPFRVICIRRGGARVRLNLCAERALATYNFHSISYHTRFDHIYLRINHTMNASTSKSSNNQLNHCWIDGNVFTFMYNKRQSKLPSNRSMLILLSNVLRAPSSIWQKVRLGGFSSSFFFSFLLFRCLFLNPISRLHGLFLPQRIWWRKNSCCRFVLFFMIAELPRSNEMESIEHHQIVSLSSVTLSTRQTI